MKPIKNATIALIAIKASAINLKTITQFPLHFLLRVYITARGIISFTEEP